MCCSSKRGRSKQETNCDLQVTRKESASDIPCQYGVSKEKVEQKERAFTPTPKQPVRPRSRPTGEANATARPRGGKTVHLVKTQAVLAFPLTRCSRFVPAAYLRLRPPKPIIVTCDREGKIAQESSSPLSPPSKRSLTFSSFA